jgi:hypothetical protein
MLAIRPDLQGQRCVAIDPPVPVTSLDQMVDSVGLSSQIRSLGGLQPGHAVFSVGADSLGAPGSAGIVEGTLPEPVQQSIADALTSTTRAQSPARWGWGMLVRLDSGDSIRWRIGNEEECAPVLANRSEIARSLQDGLYQVLRVEPGAERALSTEEARSLRMWVFIDTLGAVQNVRPVQILQHRALDSLAIATSRQMRFRPAFHNRRPVPVWIAIPLGFRLSDSAPADSTRRPPSAPRT